MMTNDSQIPGPGTDRVLGFDIIRAVAILLVLGSHAPCLPAPSSFGYEIFFIWKRGGWMAVELFFGLSGFLITSLLLREKRSLGQVSGKSFLIRRAFKLYPPALLFLIAFGAWLWAAESGTNADRLRHVGSRLWPMLVHVQNYVPIQSAEHLWSLAVEEHFYAFMLMVFLLSAATTDIGICRRLAVILPSLAALSWCGRVVYVNFFYSGAGPIGFAYTHNRVDSLIAGTLAACLVHAYGSRLRQVKVLPLLLALGVLVGTAPSFIWEIYEHRPAFFLWVMPWQAFGVGCLMLLIWTWSQKTHSRNPTGVWKGVDSFARFTAFVGRSSYSTYLWHMPFATVAVVAVDRLGIFGPMAEGSLWFFSLYIGVSLVMGVAFYLSVECPALVLRKRLFPDRGKDAPRLELPPVRQAA